MKTNPYVEQLKERERTYGRRAQYSLLLFLFVVLPVATFSSDGGGFHIKTISSLSRDFGEIGFFLFFAFSAITALVGLYSWWKLDATAKLRRHHEWMK